MGRIQTGVAATLSHSRAELVNIETVDLPRLYRSIGKRVASLQKVPPSLASHVESIRRIEEAIQSGAEVNADPQRNAAYVTLGQAVVDQYGEKAVPRNIVPELTRLKERRQALVTEITSLETQVTHRHAAPHSTKRLLLAAAGCACLAAASTAVWFFGLLPFGRNPNSLSVNPLKTRQGDFVVGPISIEESTNKLQVNREAVRSFEKAVVAMADSVKAECTKNIDALRETDSLSAIQSGYDAVLVAWRKECHKFVAPLEQESLLRQLPVLANEEVRREALQELQEKLDRELETVSDDLTRQVDSQKQSADNAFGGLNDLGQRFERRAEERSQLINQGCSSLAVAFDNATTRVASRRVDSIRKLIAKQEAMVDEVNSQLASLKAELEEVKQRWISTGRSQFNELKAAVNGRHDMPEALADKVRFIESGLQAVVDAETKQIDMQATAALRECLVHAANGTPPETIREKTGIAVVALSNRVEQAIAKLREEFKDERNAVAKELRAHDAENSNIAASDKDSRQESDPDREATSEPRGGQVKASPPAEPYDGGVDQAVLAVIGQSLSEYDEHGFAGVELGQTFDQLNDKGALPKYDSRYPWKFLSRDGTETFVFDDEGRLRVYSREFDGGVDINGEEIIRKFGRPAGETISRVFSSSQSRTNSEMIVYSCPRARVIVLIEFREARFLRYGQVDTFEKTLVCVLDQDWALPQLYRSASLKRPVLEWMQAAAERVASGSCNVDDLPLPPGTGVKVEGRGEKQVTAYLIDGGEGGREKRLNQRRLGWVTCLAEELLPYARAKPNTVGVEVDFGSYTCLESNELLKQHPSGDGNQTEAADAIDTAPVLSLLNDEVTRQLLFEYFKPVGGKYSYVPDERGGVSIGRGRYEWKCSGIHDGVFEVICNTNGSSGVYFLTKRGL